MQLVWLPYIKILLLTLCSEVSIDALKSSVLRLIQRLLDPLRFPLPHVFFYQQSILISIEGLCAVQWRRNGLIDRTSQCTKYGHWRQYGHRRQFVIVCRVKFKWLKWSCLWSYDQNCIQNSSRVTFVYHRSIVKEAFWKDRVGMNAKQS